MNKDRDFFKKRGREGREKKVKIKMKKKMIPTQKKKNRKKFFMYILQLYQKSVDNLHLYDQA